MLRLRALVVLAAAGRVLAQDPSDLARILPAETPFLFESRNPTREEMKQQCVYRCLDDPALKELMGRLFGKESALTTSTFDLGPARIALNMDMSTPDFAIHVSYADAQGKRTFKVTQRIAFAWIGLLPGAMPVDLVAALEVDTDPGQAVETLKRIIAAAVIAAEFHGKQPVVEKVVEETFHDATFGEVRYAVGEIHGVSFFLVPLGRQVLVATSEARVRDLVDRWHKGGEGSLAADARFRAMHEAAPGAGTPTSVLYLQVDRAIRAVGHREPQAAAMAAMAMGQVGLGGLRGLTSVSRVDGPGITSKTSVLIDGPRRGLARLFTSGPPASLSALEFAPKNSLYATCGSFDLRGLLDIAIEVGGAVVAVGQTKLEREIGLKLREDLLDTLDGEAGFILATNRGLLPDIALVLKVKDSERLARSLEHLLSLPGWPPGCGPVTFHLRDARVHTIPLGDPQLGGVPIAPTFALIDGHLVVTPYPMSLQRFVAVKRGVRPNLSENRDYAALRARAPEECLGLSYLDLPRVFEILYDTGMPIVQSFPPQSGANAHYELPDVEAFSHHLYGRIAWRVADEHGMHWHSHASMDTGAALMGMIGAAAATATLFAGRTSEHDIQIVEADTGEARECRNRTRLLRARLTLYREEHDGLPESLEQLRGPSMTPETFLVPGHGKPYVYLGPAGKGSVLLHGFANGRDRAVCVITTDLKLLRVSEIQLERLLGSAPAREAR